MKLGTAQIRLLAAMMKPHATAVTDDSSTGEVRYDDEVRGVVCRCGRLVLLAVFESLWKRDYIRPLANGTSSRAAVSMSSPGDVYEPYSSCRRTWFITERGKAALLRAEKLCSKKS